MRVREIIDGCRCSAFWRFELIVRGCLQVSHSRGFNIIGADPAACRGEPAPLPAQALANVRFAISGCDPHEPQPLQLALLLLRGCRVAGVHGPPRSYSALSPLPRPGATFSSSAASKQAAGDAPPSGKLPQGAP